MRISIMTFGTRGDIDPYIAIGLKLNKLGHEVTIVGPKNFIPYISQYGIHTHPLDIDIYEYCSRDDVASKRLMGKSSLMSKDLANPSNAIHGMAFSVFENAEGIIAHTNCLAAGQYISEKLEIPLIATHFYPVVETGEHASVFSQNTPFRLLNRLSHRKATAALWNRQKKLCNAKRKELGLRELTVSHLDYMNKRRTPSLHLYSSILFPRPLDWSTNNIIVGFVFLNDVDDQKKKLPQDCKQFFEEGVPPIFLSFGSMAIPNFSELLSTVKAVSEKENQRFIVGQGWSKSIEGFYHKNIFTFNSIDHSLIFPKCTGVIHHGGAGTLAAGLRTGKPTGIFSVYLDQHFWGERVTSMNVGIAYKFAHFSENSLSKMIAALKKEEVRINAEELGRAIKTEFGLNRVIAFIEDYFLNFEN